MVSLSHEVVVNSKNDKVVGVHLDGAEVAEILQVCFVHGSVLTPQQLQTAIDTCICSAVLCSAVTYCAVPINPS